MTYFKRHLALNILAGLVFFSALYLMGTMSTTIDHDSAKGNGSVECFNSSTGQITTQPSMKACKQVLDQH